MEKYTDAEFNKRDKEMQKDLTYLKQMLEFAENETNTTIDGVAWDVSYYYREVAQTALELAKEAEWFDRYEELHNEQY